MYVCTIELYITDGSFCPWEVPFKESVLVFMRVIDNGAGFIVTYEIIGLYKNTKQIQVRIPLVTKRLRRSLQTAPAPPAERVTK